MASSDSNHSTNYPEIRLVVRRAPVCVDYVSQSPILVPLCASQHCHWAVLLSSIGTVLATTAALSLQSASLAVCAYDSSTDTVTWTLQVRPVRPRLATTSLAAADAVGLVLAAQQRQRCIGLIADPRGIAGIASMAMRSHILVDFVSLDE